MKKNRKGNSVGYESEGNTKMRGNTFSECRPYTHICMAMIYKRRSMSVLFIITVLTITYWNYLTSWIRR
jgi:hypothetical protein